MSENVKNYQKSPRQHPQMSCFVHNPKIFSLYIYTFTFFPKMIAALLNLNKVAECRAVVHPNHQSKCLKIIKLHYST